MTNIMGRPVANAFLTISALPYGLLTYSFQDLPDGFGKLIRTYWSSDGADEEILIAKYISYDTADTNATYVSPVLTVQITSSFGEASEIREYKIWHRRNF